MESKRVSVVMATYNGAKYIKEQIDSILNQTYPVVLATIPIWLCTL